MSAFNTRIAVRERGLSIIELMVGIVIALLVGLTAMSSANHFTASQRTAVGAGTAAVAITSALASIKEDTAQAGLGFFGNSRYSCNALNLSAGAESHSDGTAFSPLQITRLDNDQLDVLYGSQVEAGIGVMLRTDTTSGGAGVDLNSFLPVAAGQAVVVMPATPGAACTVRSVTAVTPATESTPLRLDFGPEGLHNKVAFSTNVAYDSNARVASLGTLQWRRYHVENGNLVLTMPLDNNASATLVRNVMAFRVQYGIANSDTDTTLASWADPTNDWASLTAARIAQVRAVRIGIVARSPQKEKPDSSSGECVATTTAPTLFGRAVTLTDADWKCYRYRTSSVVVPLRNIVLGRAE